jgi:hypothetical protein
LRICIGLTDQRPHQIFQVSLTVLCWLAVAALPEQQAILKVDAHGQSGSERPFEEDLHAAIGKIQHESGLRGVVRIENCQADGLVCRVTWVGSTFHLYSIGGTGKELELKLLADQREQRRIEMRADSIRKN